MVYGPFDQKQLRPKTGLDWVLPGSVGSSVSPEELVES